MDNKIKTLILLLQNYDKGNDIDKSIVIDKIESLTNELLPKVELIPPDNESKQFKCPHCNKNITVTLSA